MEHIDQQDGQKGKIQKKDGLHGIFQNILGEKAHQGPDCQDSQRNEAKEAGGKE